MSKKQELCIRWIRVSDKKQNDNHSKPAQLKNTGEYCKENDLKVWDTYVVTESASKEKGRKQFFKMLDAAKENGIKHIVCDKIDRGARGYRAAAELTEYMDEFGGTIHFPRERFKINRDSTPNEKFLFGIGVINAKYQVENMRVELQKGFMHRFEESGKWNHIAPLGYQHVRIGKESNLHINDKEAPFVREALLMYKTGNYSQADICKFLENKIYHRPIRKGHVERMLGNSFYYGLMKTSYGKRLGVHEPLITKKDFDDIQRVKGRRALGQEPGEKAQVAKPLMGLMTCGECGSRITGEVKRKASGRQYVYYHCANIKCAQRRRNTREEHIFAQITEAFEPFGRFTPKGTQALLTKLKGRSQDLILYAEEKMGELAKHRLEAKQNLERIESLFEKGVIDEWEYQEVIGLKKRAFDSVEAQFSATKNSGEQIFTEGLKVIELFSKANNFMKLSANHLDRARLARTALSNRVLKDGTLQFSYEKPFDNLLKIGVDKNWWILGESNS